MMNGPDAGVRLRRSAHSPARRCRPIPLPFHWISGFAGFHGLPAGSALARLYRMRRLAGQEHAQFGARPCSRGSVASRRAIMLPRSVQQPEIDPAAAMRSCRRRATARSHRAAGRRAAASRPLASFTSPARVPLISLASSSGSGLDRVGVVPRQVQDRIGERAASLRVHLAHAAEQPGHDLDVALRLARRVGRLPVPLQPARRSWSGCHPPRRSTSSAAGTPPSRSSTDRTDSCSPWFSQNRAVSVSSGSITTRNFSLPSAARIFSLLGNACSGLKPWQM